MIELSALASPTPTARKINAPNNAPIVFVKMLVIWPLRQIVAVGEKPNGVLVGCMCDKTRHDRELERL